MRNQSGMKKYAIVLPLYFLCIHWFSTAVSQKVYKDGSIKLFPKEIPFPVYYFNNGFTTVFNATDLLIGDTLHPLLNRYDMLASEQDSVWVNDLADLETNDSTSLW